MTQIEQGTSLSPRSMHQHAMELASQALAEREKGNVQSAQEGFRVAADLESQAAARATSEPTRSVLHRSAASLALEAGELRLAEKLIAQALAGEPPEGIAEQLRNLLETVHFHRHLRLEGITLSPREMQFSIAGAGVSYGAAPSDAVLTRVTNVQKMLARTFQRKKNLPFAEQLKPSENVRLYMEVPRAASYAITLRLGEKQADTPLLAEVDDAPAEVISEVLDCITLVNNNDFETLERRIGDPSYYENFVALARSLAPDGDDVSVVGLTAMTRSGDGNQLTERVAQLNIKRDEIAKHVKAEKAAAAEQARQENYVVRGFLRAANNIGKRHDIRLLTQDGTIYHVIVPVALMDDIVRPHWNSEVEITGVLNAQNRILLEDLKPV